MKTLMFTGKQSEKINLFQAWCKRNGMTVSEALVALIEITMREHGYPIDSKDGFAKAREELR